MLYRIEVRPVWDKWFWEIYIGEARFRQGYSQFKWLGVFYARWHVWEDKRRIAHYNKTPYTKEIER